MATGGVVYLLTKWFQIIRIFLQMSKCRIDQATHLKITGADGAKFLISLKPRQIAINGKKKLYKLFTYKLYNYYYDDQLDNLQPIEYKIHSFTNNEIHNNLTKGIQTEAALQDLQEQFGANSTEIEIKPVYKTFVEEILTPFYIFQVFSIIVWCVEEYYYYSGFIVLSSVISIVVTLIETRANQFKLQKMSKFETKVNVFRGYAPKQPGAIDQSILQHKQGISST